MTQNERSQNKRIKDLEEQLENQIRISNEFSDKCDIKQKIIMEQSQDNNDLGNEISMLNNKIEHLTAELRSTEIRLHNELTPSQETMTIKKACDMIGNTINKIVDPITKREALKQIIYHFTNGQLEKARKMHEQAQYIENMVEDIKDFNRDLNNGKVISGIF